MLNPPKITDYSNYIDGVKIITLDKFVDNRGEITELYDYEFFQKNLQDFIIKTITLTHSLKNTIRGLHSDRLNTKILKTNSGKLQYFLIDTRPESPTYEGCMEIVSTREDNEFIVIPPRVVNGTAALEDSSLLYLYNYGYAPPSEQIHIKWNDPKYNLPWMVENPLLSERDS